MSAEVSGVDKYFSVVALFILFRETVEASIIVSVLLQFLSRSFPHLKKQVWWGVFAGVFLSIIFGIIFSVLFYVTKEKAFGGPGADIFKGCISVVAGTLIVILAFAMMRYRGWEDKIKRKLHALAKKELDKANGIVEVVPPPTTWMGRTKLKACNHMAGAWQPVGKACGVACSAIGSASSKCWAATGGRAVTATSNVCSKACEHLPCAAWRPSTTTVANKAQEESALEEAAKRAVEPKQGLGIFLMVFVTVLREGIESVIFLAGVGNAQPTSLPIPGLVGILCGVMVGFFLYYTGRQVKDIKWFLIVMFVVLLFIAGGQFMLAAGLLTSGGMFGGYSKFYNERPWYMQAQWDLQECCPDGTHLSKDSESPYALYDLSANSAYGMDEGSLYVDPETAKKIRFFQLAHAIFGYTAEPSFIQIAVYFGYWALVYISIVHKVWSGSMFDADYKYKKEMARERLKNGHDWEHEAQMAEMKLVMTSEELLAQKLVGMETAPTEAGPLTDKASTISKN